ncbi:hypothetical protein HYH03_000864 [Edaphochlamys debaryana]|uniref:Uncharacterized protein n=1 Tax=Edaphochlamys debaryana TaxID=47281 RepID=A0A835YDT7_9CHLO|nr:hypothetical protein HYH03_000864 [Edaphochlamys debaryana]|eukprot:KAG2501045.1 hypothetical protein HYH03_000864 [Edaphochlamys debaryana]
MEPISPRWRERSRWSSLSRANSFIISQFGLAAFRWCPASPGSVGPTRAGHWEVRTFNAYVFPRPVDAMNWDKRFVCQASSLTYLAAQGFDFNRMIRDGIGYIPLQARNARLASMRAELQGSEFRSGSASGSESGSATGSVEPRTPGEEAAVAGWRERVRSWLLGSDPELELPLPGLRRRRHLLRRLVQSEFQLPSLGLDPFTWDEEYGSGELAPGGGGGRRQRDRRGGSSAAASAGSVDLQLISSYEAEDEEEGPMGSGNVQLTPRQRLELLEEQSGFSQVLEALRDSRKPVVAHNAAFDLAYTLHQFFGPLPRTWAEYKSALGRAFPGGVYDTKHIAVQLASSYGLQLGDTSLGGLYGTVVDEQWLRNSGLAARRSASGLGPHEILHAPGFGSYDGITDIASKAHEAGFDAFMTGCAFARLLRVAEVRSAKHAAAVAAVGNTGSSSSSSSSVGPDAAVSSSGSLGAAAAESDGAAAAAAAAAFTSGSDGAGEALLVPVASYRGRIHMNRSDLPYANLYGSDPVTNRPAVVHMSGLTANTRAGFVVARFADMGIGPVIVSMLGASDGGRHIGALVQLPNAEMVPRALQYPRTKWKAWNLQTYADYQRAKRQQHPHPQQHKGERGEGGGPVSRAPPREISGGAGTRAAAAAPAPAAVEQQAGADARAAGSVSGTDAASTSGPGPAAAAAAGSVAAAAGAVAGASERERLKAFAQVLAVAAASVPPKPAGAGDAGAGTDPVPEPEPEPETARRTDGAAVGGGAAAATGPQVEAAAEAGKEQEAQAGPSSTARPAQAASPFANGAGGASGSKPTPGSTAAREAAERLRRLAGTSGIGGGGGGAAPGGGGGGAGAGGLSLQRPGRPNRG